MVEEDDYGKRSLGRKGWLIGNRARDRRVAVALSYETVKQCHKEIKVGEWEKGWQVYYAKIAVTETAKYRLPTKSVWRHFPISVNLRS